MAGRGEFTVKARIEAEDRASAPLSRVQAGFQKFSNFITAVWVVGILGALQAVRKAFDTIFDEARLQGQTQALRTQLAQQGQAFDTYIAKLNEVSRGTISTADLIKSSSQALLLGIPAEQIARLLEIARASAIATGRSTADAFNDIATGIGRASPLILDNLGLVVKLGPAYEAMATQLGKSVEELTSAEQKQALLNKVLEVGEGRVRAYGNAQSLLAEKLEQAAAAQANFQSLASKVIAALSTSGTIVILNVAKGYVLLARAINEARAAWNRWTGDLDEARSTNRAANDARKFADEITKLGVELAKSRDLQWDLVFGRGADEMQRAAEQSAALASSFDVSTARLEELNKNFEATRFGVSSLSTETGELNEEIQESSVSFSQAGSAAQTYTRTLQTQATQARITAAEFDRLSAAIGRTAAVQAALSGGGTLVQGGTRIRLPGGGSRLVNAAGFGGSSRQSRFFSYLTTYR